MNSALSAFQALMLFFHPLDHEQALRRAEMKKFYQTVVQSVVIVEIYNGNGGNCGTGFVLNDQVITASHIALRLDKPKDIEITPYKAKPIKGHILKYTSLEGNMGDMMSIQIDKKLPSLKLAETVKWHEPIFSIGHPNKNFFRMAVGCYTGQTWQFPEGGANFSIDGGSSGSPVISLRTGKVIGMCVDQNPSTHHPFLKTIPELRSFLKKK